MLPGNYSHRHSQRDARPVIDIRTQRMPKKGARLYWDARLFNSPTSRLKATKLIPKIALLRSLILRIPMLIYIGSAWNRMLESGFHEHDRGSPAITGHKSIFDCSDCHSGCIATSAPLSPTLSGRPGIFIDTSSRPSRIATWNEPPKRLVKQKLVM